MDIKDITHVLGRNYRISLLISFVVALGAFFATTQIKPWYKASTTLFVTRTVEKSSSFFTYEGFYSIQTAEKFTDSVVALLKSTDLKRSALDSAGIAFNNASLARLDKGLFVKKVSPQLVNLALTNKNEIYAKSILLELSKEAVKEAAEINKSGDSNISVAFVSGNGGEESVVVVEKMLDPFIIAAGFLILAFSSIMFFQLFRAYLKGDNVHFK